MAGKIKIEITLNADGTAAVHSSDRSQPIQVHQSSLGQLLDPAADLGKLLDRFAAAQAQQQKTNVQQAQAQQPPSQQVVAAAVAAAQQVVQGQAGQYSTQGQRFTGYQLQQPLASAAAANQSAAATGAFATPQTPPANVQQAQAQPGRTGLQNAAIGVHGFQAGRGIAAAVANPTIGNLANAAAAASTLSTLGAVAVAAGSVGAAFGGIAIAGSRLMESFDQAAERFGQFAPQTAGSQAFADVRQTTGDVRRAQFLDDRLSEFVTLQSEASQIWQDIKAILVAASLESIVPILRSLLEALKDIKEKAKSGLDSAGPMLDWLTRVLPKIPTNMPTMMGGATGVVLLFVETATLLLQLLRKWLGQDEEIEGGIDMLFPELPGFRLPAGVVPFRSPVDFPRR